MPEYYTYKLVESIRTERGPRQRDVLNLGVNFDLPKEQWKDLANCIEEIITGQLPLIDYPKVIRTLAKRYGNFSISPGKSYFATIQWIPAFAGMTGAHTQSSFPRRRESSDCCPDLLRSYEICKENYS